ncbi:hypothetical protein HYC85_028588 [Camellia sinensis]|uniref:Uncharacterized protein n=1 Tax=Camellia sinensis TaxID=4442 RepID=A0A7J7FWB5_CAMSI|nr:hypothetical protein HYC85_028588 [Camellia sinensis]
MNYRSGCESLSRLEKQETLYLEDNNFSKSIILCLSSLISLKNLSLHGNNLGDPFPAQGIKMRHLDLSGNHFDKDAFKILGALPSLKFLSLKSNRMEGPLSNQGLTSFLPSGDLRFDIEENYELASSFFFQELAVMTHECDGGGGDDGKFFDISLNQFTGNISPSLFGSLNSLEYIGLSHNRFEGLFSFGSFANHSNFEVVELTSDNDKFEVDTELTDWIPLFQLKILVLSNCDLSKLLVMF